MSGRSGWSHKYRKLSPYRQPRTGMLRVVVYMDDDTFEEVDAEARRLNCTVSSACRILMDIGIETMAIEREDISA